MPANEPTLSVDAVTASIAGDCIRTPAGPPRFGVELEWLTTRATEPARRVLPHEIRAALDGVRLPHGGAVTIEPGGQVELSTRAHPSLCAVLDAALVDAGVLRAALRTAGIETTAEPVDVQRPPERVLDLPRYEAMERYFDHLGPDGRMMMCNTASIQVNADVVGDPSIAWRAADAVARLLPDEAPEPCRRSVWAAIDPTRSAPVGGDDARTAWPRYALDARVMFVRTGDDACVPLTDGTTLRGWLEGGHDLGWPSAADVAEHLTTLFPPVRPRGFLELRSLDTSDDARWPALAAAAFGALVDPTAAKEVVALDERGELDRPLLAAVAASGVARLGAPSALVADVVSLAERAPCR